MTNATATSRSRQEVLEAAREYLYVALEAAAAAKDYSAYGVLARLDYQLKAEAVEDTGE